MYRVIELLAVVSSAFYGVLLARRHHMDFVGVFCLALVVAFGGGTLRDLFLDRHPLFWIREEHYPVIVFVIALISSVLKTVPVYLERYLSIPDALGLGLFSVAGTSAAIDEGTSWFVASLLGTVTGTFGGVMGDVICNRVPSLFRPAPLFATCSFVGSWIYILMRSVPSIEAFAAPVAIAFIVAFRLISIRFHLYLPHVGDEVSDLGQID
ncbi:hypothetical protein KOR42_49530 [Thalassoglobus neptunius]|uniref:Glycine transporter domain-containing protein n=1 Tax=Thalassoglobus neptunius TaxID=1938619 RepID=A0A5C5VQU3_9PLAN|nr:trimeric intracellular cation channel family protein [Thalassoglobus neptunius]TWT40171.1 hypothetical protein KOR42_49530 [Thalassoglobus neptunius]